MAKRKKQPPPQPRYSIGDKVMSKIVNNYKEELEIKQEPFWNGFTWMYSFEGMSVGQDYLQQFKPKHNHDCNECTFLGNFQNQDLYYCPQGNILPTVIARWGDDGKYSSGMNIGKHEENNLESPLGEAYRRAKSKNLVK